MPKMKTNRSASKRVRTTGSGKLVRQRQFSGCHHILEKKSPKRKRKFRKLVEVSSGDRKRLIKIIPSLGA
jgi:large subunit ribosomal protein L35